uniref:Protein kinase domain-containing protein n=1 Tax=Chlamydomonas euryale TaxID=1486919 RepID=A0A7R9YSU9_9CHLO|mmetsp:Transcript_18773/g.55952  ORF Transcript_18773/g.55952 Transcript_18773/m.55952 type:complete len:788 (+) Transcript_18773:125-2488(+)
MEPNAEPEAVLRALERCPEAVVPVARSALYRTVGLLRRLERGWYSLDGDTLWSSDGPAEASRRALLKSVVIASIIPSSQVHDGRKLHAFQVKAANGNTVDLFTADEDMRDHWVLSVNEAGANLGGLKLDDRYAIDYSSLLGKGMFSIVLRGTDRKSGKPVAIKAILPQRFKQYKDLVTREAIVWSSIGQHPNIVHLKGVFRSSTRQYFVADLASGGEMLPMLARVPNYCEQDAARVIKGVIEALAHIHARGICHADLKPENIIMANRSVDLSVKLMDFSLASFKDVPTQIGGTPEFVAPELMLDPDFYMKAGIGPEVDMWSVGILLYYLLSGSTPFFAPTFDKIVARVKTASWSFRGAVWNDVSTSAKELISMLLCKEPGARLTAQAALRHPWLARASAKAHLPQASAAFRAQAGTEPARDSSSQVDLLANRLSQASDRASALSSSDSGKNLYRTGLSGPLHATEPPAADVIWQNAYPGMLAPPSFEASRPLRRSLSMQHGPGLERVREMRVELPSGSEQQGFAASSLSPSDVGRAVLTAMHSEPGIPPPRCTVNGASPGSSFGVGSVYSSHGSAEQTSVLFAMGMDQQASPRESRNSTAHVLLLQQQLAALQLAKKHQVGLLTSPLGPDGRSVAARQPASTFISATSQEHYYAHAMPSSHTAAFHVMPAADESYAFNPGKSASFSMALNGQDVSFRGGGLHAITPPMYVPCASARLGLGSSSQLAAGAPAPYVAAAVPPGPAHALATPGIPVAATSSERAAQICELQQQLAMLKSAVAAKNKLQSG